MKTDLIHNINTVSSIAAASRTKRMLSQPFKYLYAILFRELIYKNQKKEKEINCNTFFNIPMQIFLPSSTDIYLTGGKSHISEIKLAKYLINQLEEGDIFLDVGAHYGYFSLLASVLVGSAGKVIAFEASPNTFEILKKNKSQRSNMLAFNKAVSDAEGTLRMYEFPNLYSEYNTLDARQFNQEAWFKEYQPTVVEVPAETLDRFLQKEKVHPTIIKIDVEGAEYKVLTGAKNYLTQYSPSIVMEYLSDKRNNEQHIKAEALLKELNYYPFAIDTNGHLQTISSVAKHLKKHQLESDNLVFIRKNIH